MATCCRQFWFVLALGLACCAPEATSPIQGETIRARARLHRTVVFRIRKKPFCRKLWRDRSQITMERGKTKDVEEAGTLVDKSLGTLKMRFVHLSDQLQRDLPHVAEGLNGIPHVFVWLWRINGRIVDLDSHPPPDQKAIPVLRVTRDGFQPRAIIASGGMVCFEAKTHATIVEINNYAFYSPRLQLKQDVKTEFQWLAPEPHPVEIRNIRFPQLLSGWVLVPPHHHVDLSDSRGRIKISGLPPGRLQFRVYDTGGLFIYNVVSGSDLAELSHFNTHLTVTLQAGEVVDLGEIQLTSEQPSR